MEKRKQKIKGDRNRQDEDDDDVVGEMCGLGLGGGGPWLFISAVQQEINPKVLVALLILSATRDQP